MCRDYQMSWQNEKNNIKFWIFAEKCLISPTEMNFRRYVKMVRQISQYLREVF